jgi:prepilin-type N-terminal cleavage/methylation domain-containing protein
VRRDVPGYSLLEVMFVLAIAGTLAAMTIPHVATAVDEQRTVGAARYVSTRLQRVRMEAIMRSADVAMQFASDVRGYLFVAYVDGNQNGVLTRDIQHGVDVRLGAVERLSDNFPGVEFGAFAGLPAVDPGSTPPGADPIRLGSSNLATFTAVGTATPGSLYIRGRRTQYVIRIFGDTARTRVLRFDAATNKWRPL